MQTINELVVATCVTTGEVETALATLRHNDILFVPMRHYAKVNNALHTHFRTRTFQRKRHVYHPVVGPCVAVRTIRRPVYHG